MILRQIKVIGIGGIGTSLLATLCRYLDNLDIKTYVTLVDGDRFEPKNADRQNFDMYGNKAEVCAQEMSTRFPRLSVNAKPWYMTEENAFLTICEEDIVLLCVDNHSTRRIASKRCEELHTVTLISAGNDYADGNGQIYVRRGGADVTPSLTSLYPEIEFPVGRHPAEMSCEELAQSGTPQLIFTNFFAAACMLGVFWRITQKEESTPPSEFYFDLETGNTRTVVREPTYN